ncbi:ribonuclease H-like domain-containing protein [Phycomyces blakesleeanus]|uniref:ribonuclease H n=1 Tax=Phycomyces blakesleeanus TaxID=4837 RepID=A0ABR3B904_PHYBL
MKLSTCLPNKMCQAYTDASIIKVPLSKNTYVAAIGVFFGVNDPKNLSEKYEESSMKSDIVEIHAVMRAIQAAPNNGFTLKIFTDSQAPVKASEKDTPKSYFPKATADLKKAIKNRIGPVDIIKIKGHSGEPGNVAADKLARDCAREQLK